MECKDIPIEKMTSDDEFKSKRNQLTIASVLLMTMSLSDAQIKEANTFIFKIVFSNSHAFGWLVFLSVIVLTIRYYSFAFKYHRQLFNLWSSEMINDRRLLVMYHDFDGSGLIEPHGLFSKLKNEAFAKAIGPFEDRGQEYKLTYNTGPFLSRSLSYDVDIGKYVQIETVNLNKFDDNWTKDDFLNLLKVELEYRINAFFRRSEHLELILPYILSMLAILLAIFKDHILEILK